MKLSIITINYNNVNGLKATIESVLQQTFKDFEYILIDGGSTDGSVQLIECYENNLRYWVSEPDNGIYHAMNKGIEQAKGDYCLFLNSGDTLVSQTVLQLMLHECADVGVLYGNLIKKSLKGRLIKDLGPEKKQISVLTFIRGTINHPSSFIKRDLFYKYGMYDESLKIVADWKWFLIVLGLNQESSIYRNIDVAYFLLDGISNHSRILEYSERNRILYELLPAGIIQDYMFYSTSFNKIDRVNKYIISKVLFGFIDRLVFHFDKWKHRIYNEL